MQEALSHFLLKHLIFIKVGQIVYETYTEYVVTRMSVLTRPKKQIVIEWKMLVDNFVCFYKIGVTF